jgi:hypothetical protein
MTAKDNCAEEFGFSNSKSLLRQAIHRIRNDSSATFHNYIMEYSNRELGEDISQSTTELARELLNALEDEKGSRQTELDYELVVVIHEFSQAVYRAVTGINIDYHELENANRIGMTTSGLSLLCLEECDLVTPSDLLNNCLNLVCVGEITAN